ncbi:MAG TPA: lantibiotic dehydratase C-terminal domain-containing protein [Thermoanaerobaculia bacterium]|nr:lantibiotic dehydratase C-terminal domain-containing protein [Thermoanaerobaculia bacterium]
MSWNAYHLFYHGDRDLPLTGFVAPTFGTLWRQGAIESFFFIRYALGGPHLRLRFKTDPEQSATVSATLEEAAAEFLTRCPSPEPWSERKILRENQVLLARDSAESGGGGIYPDNSFLPFPARFEIERYGGPDLFPLSLDFFALSSVTALRFLVARQGEAPGRKLLGVFRLLARQAFGLADDADELFTLFEYARTFWPPLAGFAERGDQVFAARPEMYRQVLAAEAEQAIREPAFETEAARRLRRELASADPRARRRILLSQMHMTANRLGLLNPEEVYLGQLLARSARALAETDPVLWSFLCESLDRTAQAGEGPRLAEILPAAFADLFAPPPFLAHGDPAPCSNPG